MIELRDYQHALIEKLSNSMRRGHRRPLMQAWMGLGKTRTAAEIVKMSQVKSRRLVFYAPRRDLVLQTVAAFQALGIRATAFMSGEPRNIYSEIEVASFDTVHARCIRRKKAMFPEADLAIVDEAHQSISDTRKQIIERYPFVVGLTATPARGDGRGLGEIYDDLIEGPSIVDAQRDGWLVPTRYFAPAKPDLEAVKLGANGDYQQQGLSRAMNTRPIIGDIVEHWLKLADGRPTVAFCVDRAHSRSLRDEFERVGIKAEHIDCETPKEEREAIQARIRSGETSIVVNCMVWTMGVDIPPLSCAIMARPTTSIALFFQCAGRVLRPFEGKQDALILDHAGVIEEHGFIETPVPWTLNSAVKVQDLRQKKKQEYKEPKEITCSNCSHVFYGSHVCPNCGHQIVPAGKPLPVYQAELEEVTPEKRNREVPWSEKQRFMAGFLGYVIDRQKKMGYASNLYRKRFGVWPNDSRVKHVQPRQPDSDVLNWIRYTQIQHAKRRKT